MKKFSAALLTFAFVVSTATTAFGATITDVDKEIDTARDFCFSEVASFDVSSARDFVLYLEAGGDETEFKDGFENSVKSALGEGSLTGIAKLSNSVLALTYLGEDISSFNGFNLDEMLKNTDVTAIDYNPYYYLDAVNAAELLGEDDFSNSLCDALLTYYTLGTGTDFWGGYGTSPDDLGYFITTLSVNGNEKYESYIADAETILETMNSADGYVSWSTPNGNSTAVALMAYSANWNEEKANEAYEKLLKFKGTKDGIFTYDKTDDNLLATKDALRALTYYSYLAEDDEEITKEDTTKKDTTTEKTDEVEKAKENESKTSPNTGSETVYAFGMLFVLALGILLKNKK